MCRGAATKPYTIWDDFEYRSDVPEPASIIVWSLLGLVAVGFGLGQRKRKAA
jgi:hypothetical protein